MGPSRSALLLLSTVVYHWRKIVVFHQHAIHQER